jgi:hypothetical protein
MTSTPATPSANNIARVLAWACQAAVASMYLVVIGTPAAWRPVLAADKVGAACLGLFVICMAFLWGTSLWSEQKNFYNRSKRGIHQSAAIAGHLGLFFTAMVAATEQPNPIAMWVIMPIFSALVIVVWISWMQSLALPPEDQAVIDAIHAQQAQAAVALFDASEKERRHARLGAIVASLGYELTDMPSAAPKEEAPLQTWVVPSRKHSPLVYFIRNGNRLKIGTSTELKRRIRTLALRAENVVLLVNGGQDIERAFHRQFADLRIGNTEWFAYEGALVDFVTTENHRIREEQAK